MAKIKLPVQLNRGGAHPEDHVVMLGGKGFKKLKVPTNQSITLKYGSIRREIRVVSTGSTSIGMPEALAERLGIFPGGTLCLSYKPSSRTLIMGPLIGVLVSRVYPHKPDRPFGAMTAFCRELIEACSLYGGFVYFFTSEDITSGASTVTGWTYAGRWFKRTFPIPDVVYNRLTSRKLENKPIVQHFMKEVKSRFNTIVFNERYLDKTDVFQDLRGNSSVQGYLPESYLFKNFAMLKSMCAKYSTVFLKPVAGSLGKGIIKINRLTDGGYQCSFTNLNGVRKFNYPTLTKLFQSIAPKLKGRRFQLQQGLKLIEVGGRPVDFRALVQRNQQGQWAITSVVGRIAASNTFVSNLARGGSLAPASEALSRSNLSSGSKNSANAKLRKAALDLAKGVDTNIDGHFAELGIDLAVDTAGRVWLLEINSKPSKDDNTPSGDNAIRPSVKQLVQYSQYAAKLV